MPLPREYYELLENENLQQEYPGMFPDLTSQSIKESGNALDLVGSALWGVASGLSWGGSELIAPSKPWEEMNTMERTGWILGEGASLFAPWGPFGLMGRAGSKATKLAANKFTREAVKNASEQGFKKIAGKTADDIARLSNKTKLTDDISKNLTTVVDDNLSVRWIKDLGATGKAAIEAGDNLTRSGTNAVIKAFKKSGIEILEDDALKISSQFVDGLKGGNYVNDVAEWTARTLAGATPSRVRQATSKYLGMAANDMMMMSMHSLISGKMKALANGEDFDAAGALSHSGLMALGFPLIRLIPGGGMDSASRGIKTYLQKYKSTNYKAIEAKHGEGVLRNLLKVMASGEHKGVLSQSELGSAAWKVAGKTYSGLDDILGAADNMPIKHVHTLLEKMRTTALSKQMQEWGPKYIKDLVKSVRRMGVGVVAMNPWVLQKDAWGSMEGPELASHLFISALMTKGRGAWGHQDQVNYLSDFTKYHNVLNVLNVDAKNVTDVLRFHETKASMYGMGAAISTDPIGRKITDIFDHALKDAEFSATGGDYNNPEYRMVAEFTDLYNLGKSFADSNFSTIKAHQLDINTVVKIARQLSALEFANGQTIESIGVEGALAQLTIGPAKEGVQLYKNMLAELGELGFQISVGSDGRTSAYEINPAKEGESLKEGDTVNRILFRLGALKEVDIKRDPNTLNIDQVIKKAIDDGKVKNADEFHQQARLIMEKWMSRLSNEYGDKLKVIDPVDNPFFEFFERAKAVEASEKFMQIVMGTAKDDIGNITVGLDNMFKLKDGRYAASIDEYLEIVEGYKKVAAEGKESETNINIVDKINDLRQLFELRKTVLGVSKHNARSQGEISQTVLNEVFSGFEAIKKQMPFGWESNWHTHTRQSYMERIYKGKGLDRRAVNLATFLQNNRLALPGDNGQLVMPSREAFLEVIRHTKPKDQQEVYEKAFKTIEKVLGDNVITYSDYMYPDSKTGTGSKHITEVDVSKLLKAYEFLGNDILVDALTSTHTGLEAIMSESSGTRKIVKDIFTDIENVLTNLEPNIKSAPLKDPIKDIQNIADRVESLLNTIDPEKSPVAHDLGSIMSSLQEARDNIDSVTSRFKVGLKRVVKNVEGTSKELPIHEALRSSMQSAIANIAGKENQSIYAMQQLMVKIQNLMGVGSAGLGLSKTQITHQLENLAREWNDKYNINRKDGVVVLSEMIKKVNNNGFFTDAIDLIAGVNKSLNQSIILSNKHHEFNSAAQQALEATEKGYKAHERHRTTTDIAREYNLLDKDSNIDSDFIVELSQNPHKALVDKVRNFIYKDPSLTNVNQRRKKWNQFLSKDAFELIIQANNAAPIDKWKLINANVDGGSIIEFSSDVPNVQHPNTNYYKNKGYKVAWLDGTASSLAFGKLRSVSLEHFSDPNVIQKMINEGLRTNSAAMDLIKGFQEPGGKRLTAQQVQEILNTNTDYLFYLRLSPTDRIIFAGTDANIKTMNTEFKTWYDNTLNRYGKDTALGKTFKAMVGHLESAEISRHNVELKMMLPYLDHMGRRAEFKSLIEAHITGESIDKIKKIEANMFKRGFLSDGGTTQPLNDTAIKWAANHHGIKSVRNFAKLIDSQGGIKTSLINDSEAADDVAHPLNIERISKENLDIITNPNNSNPELLKAVARLQKTDLSGVKSLMNSLLDGAKFASKDLMKLVMASKGMLNTNFINSPNGAKTVVFAVGGNQMLGKGYLIYHPDIAASMPKDTHLMMGTESAKAFDGNSMALNPAGMPIPLEAYNIDKTNPKWQLDLANVGDRNSMLLPTEALGVSFTSKNTKGVSIAGSIFDFQNKQTIDDAIVMMGFASKLRNISTEYGGLHTDGGRLAAQLISEQEAQGNQLDKGDSGLTKLLFQYGASPDNPLVTKAIRRLLRSSTYSKLNKSPNMHGGEDNYIVPNIEGDLSAPVHAEIYRSIGATNNTVIGLQAHNVDNAMINRTSMRFGGIGINTNTAARKMGTLSSKEKAITSNLTGEAFVFSDPNGVDVLIEWNGSKFVVDSPFYNNLGKTGVIAVEFGNREFVSVENPFHTIVPKYVIAQGEAESVIVELNKIVQNHSLRYRDVFDLLNGHIVSKTNTATGFQTSLNLPSTVQKLVNKLNLRLVSTSHAVPVLGHDKVVHRVEKILTQMDGLVEINSHDLRAILQRDNDGDHFYTHTKMDWDLLKVFANENGRKRDVLMFDRSKDLNQDFINIFGIDYKGDNMKMGAIPSQTGFHQYASTITKSKMAIGKIIGARGAISWLDRVGFSIDRYGDNNYYPVLHSMNATKSMVDPGWKILDRLYDTIQNSMDVHAGIHKILQDGDRLEDFLFYGKTGGVEITDPVLKKHVEAGGMFADHAFGKTKLERMVFSEILRTFKKASQISRDVWDEGGQRSPEIWDLKDSYHNIDNFFKTPTQYLARKMARQIARVRKSGNIDQADALVNEYLQFFYKDRLTNRDKDEIYTDLLKGRMPKFISNVFNFKHISPPTEFDQYSPSKGFDFSIAGHVLRKILYTPGFQESNYEGITQVKNERDLRKAGLFVQNIESFVEIANMYGDNPVQLSMKMDIDIGSFGSQASTSLKKAVNNGILRDLIHKQYRQMMSTLEYFREEKFTNPKKLDKIVSRLENLQSAIDIMDHQIAKGMVIDSKTSIKKTNSQEQPVVIEKLKWLKDGQKVAVYRVKGDVRPIVLKDTKVNNVSDLTLVGTTEKSLHYGQLEHVGIFNNKGYYKKVKGYTYIVDHNPKQYVPLTDNEFTYSRALWKSTGSQVFDPELFLTNKDFSVDFRNDVHNLRNSITFDYIQAVRDVQSNRNLRDIFTVNSAKESAEISRFIETWKHAVDPTVIPQGYNAEGVLLRHLLRPRITNNMHHTDHNGNYVISYRQNEHLMKTVMTWAEHFNHSKFNEFLIKDIQKAVNGEDIKPDITSYDRAQSSKYDFSQLGELTNPFLTLLRHYNAGFFSSPILEYYINQVQPKYPGKVRTIETSNGHQINVRKKHDLKGNYFNMRENLNPGRDC